MNKRVSKTEELGKRAVACKHWRWMDGMTVHGLPTYRVVSNNCDGHTYRTDGYDSDSLMDCFPDLSDPATLGCLLALVREAYRNNMLWAFPVEDARGKWSITIRDAPQKWFYGSTETEALVAALEAAP